MKISEIITELQCAKNRYGDLTVHTFDGTIRYIGLSPSFDGCIPQNGEEPNEISLEIETGS